MSEVAEKLKTALLELPVSERLDIADFLYESLPAPPGALRVGTPEFDAEIDRRRAEYESGADPGIDMDEMFQKLEERGK